MKFELTKTNKSKDLAKSELLWLLNLENGRVFPWTTLLSVKKGFIDCTEAGVPINPKDVPGDHPWIIQQTHGLADRMGSAGANADTLQDFGRQLTDDGNAKFKSLEYEHSKTLKLEDSKSAAQTGAMVRIYNKIDRMCERAQKEIKTMAFNARIKQGLL